jgi:transposase
LSFQTATFRTFTADLEQLCKWLEEHQAPRAALEFTGVFGIPVWNILERSKTNFQLTLINPQHAHTLPGRTTDQKDCERIAEWLQYGLLKLETANVKLGSVVSDIHGRTAQLILDEIAQGHCDPKKPAQLAQAGLKNKRTEITVSLHGFYSKHFRWLLSEAVQELAYWDHKLEQIDKRLAKQLQPQADLILRLCTIPGVEFTTAAVLPAEIGFDVNRFADATHLASWAGLCLGTTRVRASATRVARARETAICAER